MMDEFDEFGMALDEEALDMEDETYPYIDDNHYHLYHVYLGAKKVNEICESPFIMSVTCHKSGAYYAHINDGKLALLHQLDLFKEACGLSYFE